MLIPVRPIPSPLPPSAIRLLIRNVPLSCSRVGLPDALLQLAGYNPVRCPTRGPLAVPAADSTDVVLLQYRLGGHANAAEFVVDVLPPASDPHLRLLPLFAPQLSTPGEPQFSVLVRDDPLPRAPRSSDGLDSPPVSAALPPPAPIPPTPDAPPISSLRPTQGFRPSFQMPAPVIPSSHHPVPLATPGLRPVPATSAPQARGSRTLPSPAPSAPLHPVTSWRSSRALSLARALALARLRPLLPPIPEEPSSDAPRRPALPSPAAVLRPPVVASAAAPAPLGRSDPAPASAVAVPSSVAECPICYQELSTGNTMHTSCAHAFHPSCLHRWFAQGRSSCPICRFAPLPEAAPHQPPQNQPPQRFGLIPDLVMDDGPRLPALHVPLPDPGPIAALAEPDDPPAPSPSVALPVITPDLTHAATAPVLPVLDLVSASPADLSVWWRQGAVPSATEASTVPSPPRTDRRHRSQPAGHLGVAPVVVAVRRSRRPRQPPQEFWRQLPSIASIDSMDWDYPDPSDSDSPTGHPPRVRRGPVRAATRRGSAGGAP